jgi:hypothetical protein
MGFFDRLFEIVTKDPDLEKSLQDGFKRLLVEKVDPDSQLSDKARKERMRFVVDQMTQPDFVDTFKDRHAYYGALLETAARTAAVCSRGVIVEHLHLPGYHFYFPPSTLAVDMDLAARTHKDSGDPLYAVMLKVKPEEMPYEFVAFKIPTAFTGSIEGVRAKLVEIVRDEPNEGERRTFLAWLDSNRFRPIALQAIGRKLTEERYYFLRVFRTTEILGFNEHKEEYGKMGWTPETLAMKLGGGKAASSAMKEGLEEALHFEF